MSNPAVIELHRTKIGRSRVWLDDNLGESIHIHIDNFRIDLTNDEFDKICKDLLEAINNMVLVEGFDCALLDPVYLQVMLWKDLLHLNAIKTDCAKLGDLIAPGHNGASPLAKSRAVKALCGDTTENDGPRPSHHLGQTSGQRLDEMYNSIKEHGYPWKDQYIILYGDDNIIRDGQHRAACLYTLFGDMEVPVKRFYFDNYQPGKIHYKTNKLFLTMRKVKVVFQKARRPEDLYAMLRRKGHVFKEKQRARAIQKNKQRYSVELKKLEAIFETK